MSQIDPSDIHPGRDLAANADLFRHMGVISPVPLLSASQVQRVLDTLDGLTRTRGGDLPPMLRAKPHLLVPQLWDLVTHPTVVAQVAAILGPDVLCFGSSLIWKPPARSLHVSWHQDATHWGLSRPDAVTVWLALTPSTRESGCVLVIPRSHDQVVAHDHPDDPDNMLGRKEVARTEVQDTDTIALELTPGEASMHHALILHGSGRNTTQHDRIGFAMRYIATGNGQASGTRGTATLVAGRDHGAYDLEQNPEGLMHPAAMRRHAQVLRAGHKIIFGS